MRRTRVRPAQERGTTKVWVREEEIEREAEDAVRQRKGEKERGREERGARMQDRLQPLGGGSGCNAAGGGSSSPREPRKMEINYIYT